LILFGLLILSLNIYGQSGSRKEIVSYINKILTQGVNIKFNSSEDRSPITNVKFIDRKNLVILALYEFDDSENSRGILFQFNPSEILSVENVLGSSQTQCVSYAWFSQVVLLSTAIPGESKKSRIGSLC